MDARREGGGGGGGVGVEGWREATRWIRSAFFHQRSARPARQAGVGRGQAEKKWLVCGH